MLNTSRDAGVRARRARHLSGSAIGSPSSASARGLRDPRARSRSDHAHVRRRAVPSERVRSLRCRGALGASRVERRAGLHGSCRFRFGHPIGIDSRRRGPRRRSARTSRPGPHRPATRQPPRRLASTKFGVKPARNRAPKPATEAARPNKSKGQSSSDRIVRPAEGCHGEAGGEGPPRSVRLGGTRGRGETVTSLSRRYRRCWTP